MRKVAVSLPKSKTSMKPNATRCLGSIPKKTVVPKSGGVLRNPSRAKMETPRTVKPVKRTGMVRRGR